MTKVVAAKKAAAKKPGRKNRPGGGRPPAHDYTAIDAAIVASVRAGNNRMALIFDGEVKRLAEELMKAENAERGALKQMTDATPIADRRLQALKRTGVLGFARGVGAAGGWKHLR